MKHSREGERKGLSTSGLSNSDYITAAQSHRPRLALDGGRSGETLRLNGAHQIVRKRHFVEGSDGTRHVAPLYLQKFVKKS
jgi:hypothetical protein